MKVKVQTLRAAGWLRTFSSPQRILIPPKLDRPRCSLSRYRPLLSHRSAMGSNPRSPVPLLRASRELRSTCNATLSGQRNSVAVDAVVHQPPYELYDSMGVAIGRCKKAARRGCCRSVWREESRICEEDKNILKTCYRFTGQGCLAT